MSTTLTINVTQAHIDAGQRASCSECPVALAMLAAGIERPRAYGGLLMGVLGGKAVEAETPNDAFHFICNFDHTCPVRPFKFSADFRETK